MFFVLSKAAFLLLRPSNAVIVAMVLGLLLRLTRFRRTGAVIFGGAFLALAAAGWTGLSTVLMEPLERRFPEPDLSRSAPTGIVILGGAIDTTASVVWNGTELVDGAERLLMGAELARRFPTAKVIFTGGSANYADGERAEAVLAGPVLRALGVAPERLVLEDRSRNTRENASLTYELVQPQPGDHWLLVTSAAHMPRAVGTFRGAGWSGITAVPVDHRVTPGLAVLGRQYASEGLFLTDIAAKEWLGLLAYRFAGYADALLPGP